MYFGGGTPSLVPPRLIADILRALDTAYGIAPTAEVTLEADPGTFDMEGLCAYKDVGINRFSVGVQVGIVLLCFGCTMHHILYTYTINCMHTSCFVHTQCAQDISLLYVHVHLVYTHRIHLMCTPCMLYTPTHHPHVSSTWTYTYIWTYMHTPPSPPSQSFQDELLQECGRAHGLKEVEAAIEALHRAHVGNWSLDLISGRGWGGCW